VAGLSSTKRVNINPDEGLSNQPTQQPRDSKNTEDVEDDELEIEEDDLEQIEGVVIAPHQTEQKKPEKMSSKTKASEQVDAVLSKDKNSRKLAERAKAEERKAEQRSINKDAAETEEELVEFALKRKSDTDKAL
jgi:hypothetical protein